jgi:hypothetical protein
VKCPRSEVLNRFLCLTVVVGLLSGLASFKGPSAICKEGPRKTHETSFGRVRSLNSAPPPAGTAECRPAWSGAFAFAFPRTGARHVISFRPVLILSCDFSQAVSFIQVFRLKFCVHFSYLPGPSRHIHPDLVTQCTVQCCSPFSSVPSVHPSTLLPDALPFVLLTKFHTRHFVIVTVALSERFRWCRKRRTAPAVALTTACGGRVGADCRRGHARVLESLDLSTVRHLHHVLSIPVALLHYLAVTHVSCNGPPTSWDLHDDEKLRFVIGSDFSFISSRR